MPFMLLRHDDHRAGPCTVTRCNDVEVQQFDDVPFERPGPVELCPYGQSVWGSNDGVLRSMDDAQGSVPHRRLCFEHVANLPVHVLGSLTEIEVPEWVTTTVGQQSMGSTLRNLVIRDGG